MFFAACSNKNYYIRKLGTRIDKWEKWLCGCICINIFLIFLIGPFLAFSNLSIFSTYNLVTDGTLTFNAKLKDLSTDETYQT